MSEFRIQKTKTAAKADELQTYGEMLQLSASDVLSIARNLSIRDESNAVLVSKLTGIAKLIEEESKSTKQMSKSLSDIVQLYLMADEEVVKAGVDSFSQWISSHSGDKTGISEKTSDSSKHKREIIEEYEKKHPEDAKKINKFLSTGDGKDLTDEDVENIKYLIYTAKEPYRSIYINSLSKFRINTINGSGGYYTPWKHTVTYDYPDCFSKDPRGAYTVFFHECGHAIDDLSDKSKWLGADTENYKYYSEGMKKKVTFLESIKYDVYYNPNNPHSITSIASSMIASGKSGDINNVINAFMNGNTSSLSNADLRLYNAVRNEFNRTTGNDVHYEAVTDVYGGVSHNALRNNGYGHSNDYWNDTNMPASELWAEYFSYNMANDTESLQRLREYFPETAKMLDAYANDLGGS